MAQSTIRSYFGGRVRVVAAPVPGWTSAIIGAVGFAHRSTEWIARRWAPRFYPLIRFARIASILVVVAFAWAGAGIQCIRIKGMFYIHGTWMRVDDIVDVRGPGAPHPVYRQAATTIVLRSGRVIESDVALTTVRDIIGNWR